MPKQVKKVKHTIKKASPAKKTNKKNLKKTLKTVVSVTPPIIPTVASPLPSKNEAQKIWDEIMNLPIQMFGLPNQFVFQHCTPVTVEPSKLYVIIRSSAALPSLEAAIAPVFQVELVDKFVVIKRAPALLASQKR